MRIMRKKNRITFEARMIQSRIVSEFISVMESSGVSIESLSKKTDIREKDLELIFNIYKWPSLKDIAKIQEALDVVLQISVVSRGEHNRNHYSVGYSEVNTE